MNTNITNDIKYIGVNDHDVDLFEGQYIVPNGMAYNSYAIIDENINHLTERLPEDIVCPLCKHGAVDFEEIV